MNQEELQILELKLTTPQEPVVGNQDACDRTKPAAVEAPRINVVLNWMEELKARVPVK